MRINILVDSGAYMMAINDTIQAQLDLPFVEKRKAQMASGDVIEYEVVGPLMIKFANRTATCSAFVLPGGSEPRGFYTFGGNGRIDTSAKTRTNCKPEHPNYAQLKMK